MSSTIPKYLHFYFFFKALFLHWIDSVTTWFDIIDTQIIQRKVKALTLYMKEFGKSFKDTLTFFALSKTAVLRCLHFTGALK